eukprot:762077-Hanusia_phi.AAC.1
MMMAEMEVYREMLMQTLKIFRDARVVDFDSVEVIVGVVGDVWVTTVHKIMKWIVLIELEEMEIFEEMEMFVIVFFFSSFMQRKADNSRVCSSSVHRIRQAGTQQIQSNRSVRTNPVSSPLACNCTTCAGAASAPENCGTEARQEQDAGERRGK